MGETHQERLEGRTDRGGPSPSSRTPRFNKRREGTVETEGRHFEVIKVLSIFESRGEGAKIEGGVMERGL